MLQGYDNSTMAGSRGAVCRLTIQFLDALMDQLARIDLVTSKLFNQTLAQSLETLGVSLEQHTVRCMLGGLCSSEHHGYRSGARLRR